MIFFKSPPSRRWRLNSQVLRWSIAICLLLVLPFTFNSCQKSSGGGDVAATGKTSSCKAIGSPEQFFAKSQQAAVLESPFAASKLQLHGSSEGSSKLSNSVVRAGSELAVMMDNACVRSKTDRSVFGKVVSQVGPHPSLNQQSYTWTLERDYSESELESLSNQNPCVVGVSWNQYYKMQSSPQASVFNDPQFPSQEHFSSIRAQEAYFAIYNVAGGLNSASGDPILIAEIDTGIDWTHPDIYDNLWQHSQGIGIDITTLSGVRDYNPYDVSDNGHGTHVAGLISAVTSNAIGVAGVMPFRAKIMAIKIFKRNSSGEMVTTSTDLANGINFAANNNAKIANISLGAISNAPATDSVVEAAVNSAVNKGTLLVVVIGNSDSGAGAQVDGTTLSSIPGQYATKDGVIGVASYDTSTGNKSYFSHYSTTYAEIAAPGAVSSGEGQTAVGLLSTIPTGILASGYGRLAGTSQAAPIVSAAAGIAFGLVRNATGTTLTPAQLEQLIISSAPKSSSLTPYVKNGNRLDLKNLVYKVNQVYPLTLGGRPLPPCP